MCGPHVFLCFAPFRFFIQEAHKVLPLRIEIFIECLRANVAFVKKASNSFKQTVDAVCS